MARCFNVIIKFWQTEHINPNYWSDKLRVGRIVQRPQCDPLNHIFNPCNDTDFRISNGAVKSNKLAI